ncbi:MAG TPA: phospholipase D-like domain-containing protein [Candidatus Saccharimonadia bacterium]|jgi:phosphatidylserine/phosphatidylglycerophosphate/cardiolipin synthase-like enzyme
MPATKFTFYSKPEYFAELIQFLNDAQPGERFVTVNMVTIPWQPGVAEVLDAMVAAARRGVQVTLLTDARNFLIAPGGLMPGPLFYHRRLPRRRLPGRFQQQRRALETLKAAGGRYVILNRPAQAFTNPWYGRNHIKFTVCGDRYFVGGCNLDNSQHIDLMVAAHDASAANWLVTLAERMLATGSAMASMNGLDFTHETSSAQAFFLDAGVPRRSLIFEQAVELIAASREHVFLATQYFPGGEMGQALLAAHLRGATVTIVYNHPSLFSGPMRLLNATYNLAQRHHLPESFFAHANAGPSYLHAKLLATEHGAILGSHNFVEQGVNFGTAEIALLVRDPKFARQATQTVLSQLSQ